MIHLRAREMAIGATHAFVSIAIIRRSSYAPVSLARTLLAFTSRFPLKIIHKHLSFNPANRNLSCTSAVTSDVSSTSASDSISNNSYPPYSRLLPCPVQNVPPRVEHLVVSEGGHVLNYISRALNLPPIFVADLIHFGAVFYSLVSPDPPRTATPEQIDAFKKSTVPSVLRKRSSLKGMTMKEAQQVSRISSPDEFVEAGTYLRVHVHPKRFPRCYEIDWRSRVIAVTEDYVVLDKPAGTSVGGTTDNIEERCVTFTTRALGLQEPLMTTHQIDNCTEGCVVLARTKKYCSVFHAKIREKNVKKLYLALAAAHVPLGLMTHYMRPTNIAPRLISEDFISGWYMCQLEVLECKKVPWPSRATQEKYCIEDCGWPTKDFAYEIKINLLTGRTHQIRAQLAACGAPLIGDTAYMQATISELNHPGSNPFGKNKTEFSFSDDVTAQAVEEWIACHGKVPSVAIGLQACHISWDSGEHSYEAGSPWWR